jgi:hypothetical protein
MSVNDKFLIDDCASSNRPFASPRDLINIIRYFQLTGVVWSDCKSAIVNAGVAINVYDDPEATL